MSRWLRLGRNLLLGVAGVGYALLLLVATVSTQSRELSITLALLPVGFFLVWLAWSSSYRYSLILMMAVLGAVVWLAWGEALVENYQWFYLLQHAGIYCGLALFFARTLLPRHTPLITRCAAIVHGDMPPEQIRYTRRLTAAWAIFFISIALLSLLLFMLAPIEYWALFANILSPVLIGLMFGVEHFVRHRALPDVQHVTIAETIRATTKYFREHRQSARL